MAKIFKNLNGFNIGMTPDLYKDGISRLEHFDLTTPQARPVGAITASTMYNSIVDRLTKFTKGYGRIYALGREAASGYGTVALWDNSNYRWESLQALGTTAVGSIKEIIKFYRGHLYGLTSGTHMWKVSLSSNGATSTGVNMTAFALTYSNACDMVIHSKDGKMYIGVDNKIYSFDGTTLSTELLTLPDNFRIMSTAEQGDYLEITGYDTLTGTATSYLWDRDSSLTTLTEKYELGDEIPYHNATLGGTHFIISLRGDNSNSAIAEKPRLVIRYIEAGKAKLLAEFPFTSLTIGGKYIDGNYLYFNAYVIFLTESTGHWLTFRLDSQGRLYIALNMGINDAAGTRSDHPGIVRDGDGYWVGGGADGQWNTAATYGTTSIIETTKHHADDLTKNIDAVGFAITFEPLASGAAVVVKTRKNEETSWTTLKTFDTDNDIKGVFPVLTGKTAKERQYRIESTGGAVITGFQAVYDEISNEQI